ncbi:MAG: hypothetical protein QF600_02035 [Verrucomicrobiota bacterium]|jgi:hypothetical protein|nr:hypothetical protein [Verrucomicrobiota bacterium]
MKQAHSFLFGGITATLIIACSGSSGGDPAAGQPIKLDSNQVDQIVTAIKKAKWEYKGARANEVAALGKEGWEIITYDPASKVYYLKRRID